MITPKTKQRLAQLCHLSYYLDPAGLSVMYKYFVRSRLEYGHLLYFGAARGYLNLLDVLQCWAASVCHSNFPSLECRRHAAAIGLLCRLLDGEGHGDLQSLLPSFITSVSRRSFALITCQILLKHLDCKIPSHSRVWTAIAEVGVVRFRHCGTIYLLIYY